MNQFGEKLKGVSYIDRPGAYAIMTESSGRLAVIRTPTGYFLPGGGIEAGEDPITALRREILEETGLEIADAHLIGTAAQFIYSAEEQKGFNKIGSFFRVQGTKCKATPIELDHEILWLSLEEATQMLKHEFQRWAIAKALGSK